MSELDFDRSLPPIMPNHGQWFNDRVAELVELANGNEKALEQAVIAFPRNRSDMHYIPMVEYPAYQTNSYEGSQLRTS